MTEPGLACTTTVASRAFRLQCNVGVCTHYRDGFACRADGAIRVVLPMMNFVTQLEVAESIKREGERANTMKWIELFTDRTRRSGALACPVAASRRFFEPLHNTLSLLCSSPSFFFHRISLSTVDTAESIQ